MKYKYFFLVLIVATAFKMVAAQNPKYEFRAAWIATVENIDWPSKKGLPVEEQKAEYIKLIDKLQSVGMNAVIMQIRPAADAFYPSKLEPWSEYLTGVQGQAPSPLYDPLKFMIEETHKRNMEFHAWCNPYRAVFNIAKSNIAATHISNTQKSWFVTYGGGAEAYKKYFDPGNPDARNFVTEVVKDIVTRYDVDAIHFDDYFYPYRIAGKEFPDSQSFAKYGKGLSKDAWRRSNCDSIILQLSKAIKKIKPNVKFGISPFGVWRNKSQDIDGSETQAGQTNYDDLYADILLWQKKNWIDYIVPQLYWEIGHNKADYTTLVNWWAKHSFDKHVYIGHGFYRAGSNTAWKDKKQIPDQINMLRKFNTIQGSAYFSAKNFYKNLNGWNDTLQKNLYSTIALIPPMKWIDNTPPPSPIVSKSGKNILVKKAAKCERLRSYVIYAFAPGNTNANNAANIIKQVEATDELVLDEKFVALYAGKQIAITALDWNNNESAIVFVK
jgi:uncharacterized lipoprotein YddW (UPF0748 family)